MKDCIFCKIVKGEIPSTKVYEDADFIAFLDIQPQSKGHTLIVPKLHYANLYELPDELAAKVLPLAKKLSLRLNEKFKPQGLNAMQNNGEIAGQTVMHYHLHLVPRYTKAHIEKDMRDLAKIAQQIRLV